MDISSSSSVLTASVKDLLEFFDEKPSGSEKHATGIVGIVGEDLNAACFIRYLESNGDSAEVLTASGSNQPLPVTTGMQKGPRLDRWIKVDWRSGLRSVFQTEIKNWSAHAFGGKRLLLSATPNEVTNHKQARWDWHWDGARFREASAAKVLVPMKPPAGFDNERVRPLLIFWEPIGPREQSDDHLFNIPLPDSEEFPEFWVFSVSSYLRSISDARIELNMPNAAHRLRTLTHLFPTGA